MKIAIYTIARNEELFAERFMRACRDADLIVVGDTGSEDATATIIKDFGGQVVPLRVSPWRFDVPRNALLSLLPDVDICIAPDLDEFLTPGWRDRLEQQWKPGEHTRLRFRYVHSYNSDGTYSSIGMKSFAHAREGYVWKHRVHETLYYEGPGQERLLTLPNFVIEHRQDLSKPRTSYLPLLEAECADPCTSQPTQHLFWLIREYANAKNWEKLSPHIQTYLRRANNWPQEAAYVHIYKARMEEATGQSAQAHASYLAATLAAPPDRDAWLALAEFLARQSQWVDAYAAVLQCLAISRRPEHYLSDDRAWGASPHLLAAKCADILTYPAREHITLAVQLDPHNPDAKQLAAKHGIL